MEKMTIPLKDRIIVLQIQDFDTDIDTYDLTSIDYHNILGEILTFSVVMNRIGNLQADMDEIVEELKFDIEIKEASLSEYYRKELTKKTTDSKGNDKIKEPTIPEVKNAVLLDKAFDNLKRKLFRIQKEKKYIEALYWAIKSKDDKLNKLSEKLRPEEFEKEILEDTINDVIIKNKEKLIK